MQTTATRPVDAKRVILSALIPVLAVVAGAIHLAHNYLPMGMPADSGGGPPAGGGSPGDGPGGLMSLVMPYLSQIMLLNFVTFVGLAIVFVLAARSRPRWRATFDVLLVLVSGATLYAWNAMGQSNPYGTGTLALIVEAALVVLALADAALALSTPTARSAARLSGVRRMSS